MQHPDQPGRGSPDRGAFPPPQSWAAGPNYGAAGAAGPVLVEDSSQPRFEGIKKWKGETSGVMSLKEEAVDLHEDTYSWLFLTLVKHWQAQDSGHDSENTDLAEVTHISLLHAIFVWAFSVVLELCVVVFFLVANMELGEKVSDEYFHQHYHMSLQRAAEALQQSARAGVPYNPPDVLEACVQQAAWAQMTWIYYVTLTFWLMTMVTEIKEASWIAVHIYGVQTKAPGSVPSSLLYEDDDRGLIVRMEWWQKATVFTLVPFLRIVISLVLTYSGAKYLIMSTKVTDMVVKTVALQFVIKMDNVAAESLLTMGDLDELKAVKVLTKYGHPDRDSLWDKGIGGMFYMCFIALSLIVLTEFVYYDIFAFRFACGAYHEEFKIDGVKNMMTFMIRGWS